MIWKTAWKNVWRKKTRSLIIITSVVIGVLAGVFTIALMNGMIIQRVDSALNTEISHIQITHKKFRDNNDINLRITNTDSVISAIKNITGVNSIAKRTILSGMINSTDKNSGVQIVGIDPEDELKVFNLNEFLIEGTGSYFDTTDYMRNRVFIGEALAKDLNIINYTLKDGFKDELIQKEVPEIIASQLEPLLNKRFKNEKLFNKAISKIIGESDALEYGSAIRSVSKDFRDRARLVLTFLDDNNIQTGASFRIAGLYNLTNNMFERSQVFVLNSDIRQLAGIPENEYHQLIVKLNDTDSTNIVLSDIKSKIPGLEAKSWMEISPELALTTDLVKQFYAIFMIIILAALAFGILNTMLMVVLERVKELGMLTAIGMNKRRVFSMIMLESVFLSFTGGLIGMVLSKVIIDITAINGIDLSSYAESFEEMGYTSLIYPQIDNEFFIIVGIMIILTGILSAIYPAYKALKLNPAEAIRTE